jgi:hypothetical protein
MPERQYRDEFGAALPAPYCFLCNTVFAFPAAALSPQIPAKGD